MEQFVRKGKRLLALCLCLCLMGTMIPVTVRAEESKVEYRYCDGNGGNWQTGTKSTGDYTVVTSSDTEWTGTAEAPGWYVVQGTDPITISGMVTISGDVHLILTDNSSLTVTGGILVKDGNRLTIYG